MMPKKPDHAAYYTADELKQKYRSPLQVEIRRWQKLVENISLDGVLEIVRSR